ncbi:F-box only protein 21 isoform X2 [Parasteatoda tepidariorum]|uniref:F-box only protein 21 isoform X2 n=1 Tax=Parasteatoda tepidariorum TaxID=114398 RepID=UPI00077F92D5|nr:F-box only protein 21 isoform X2 [Parasteatoda tepidariorum]
MNKIFPSLHSLPAELIEQILCVDSISYIDVCKIATVSKLFNCISKSNKLWYTKYSQMWPTMDEYFDPVSTDWSEEFQRRINIRKAISKELCEMTKDFYHVDNVSNDSFHNFKSVCENHPFTDYILVDELMRILKDPNRHSNLTLKYYAEKALIYVRHTMLDTIWRTFLNIGPRPSLLKGACLIQQWCEPSKVDCTIEVSNKVNSLIEMVFNEIKVVCPSHPVIQKGYSSLHDENEVLENSLWSPYRCKVILNCINSILYGKLGWSCVEYMYTFENIYIGKALDKNIGIPVTLGILYETIANQLGVRLLSVNFPGHFLLKWLEHPEMNDAQVAWTYIDIFSNGAFKKEHELQDLAPGYNNFTPSWLESVPPVKVFATMCWNLVEVGRQHDESSEGLSCLCNSLELLSILCPDDLEHKLLLARVYMHLCVNITRVISLLQEIAENDPVSTGFVGYMYRTAITTLETQQIKKDKRKVKSQKRVENCANVDFAVGMIMTHKKYDYRCVIYGWDPLCTASKEWIIQMGVDKLKYKDKQPFYHVLVADGTNRYAAQENLVIDDVKTPITHMEIGRYFESFHGSYYLPNEQKRLEYPDDIAARERTLSVPLASSSSV